MKTLVRIRGTREYDFLEVLENGTIHAWVEGEETMFRTEEVKQILDTLNSLPIYNNVESSYNINSHITYIPPKPTPPKGRRIKEGSDKPE